MRETDAADTPAAGNESSVARSQTPEEEFGDKLATLLGTPPATDQSNSLAAAMLEQATNDPSHIRDWLEQQVPEAAGECECEVPLPKWDKKKPNRTTTCGNQQGILVSQVDIQHVLDRQKEREGNGDNVSYVLARTIRSNL
ncbi:unnamed protein product [Pylaiella littoralis]